MRRIGRVMIAAALPLVAGATAARAQLSGIPVYFNPHGGTGVGVAANVGFSNSDAGGGTAYGVAGSFGAGPITLTGMVGTWKPHLFGSGQTTFGADVAYKVFGGGLLPIAVAVQAGYGSIKLGGVTQGTVPIGVGLSFDPPLFPLKPWIAPRVDLVHAGSSNTTNFRISAGVNFNLLLGFGVHAAVDWGQTKVGGTTFNPLIVGVGAHFNFHVPMM